MHCGQGRLANLLYVSVARIPSEKANTYQVLQMCAAFAAQGIDITLLYPRRVNTPAMRRVRDVKEYYGLRQDYPMVSLPTLDLLWSSYTLLGWWPRALAFAHDRLLFPLLRVTYTHSMLKYLRRHAADLYYFRDLAVLSALVRSRPDLAPRVLYEAHAFPSAKADQQRAQAVLPQIRAVVAITYQLKDLYTRAGVSPEKILVAPDGVDLERFKQVAATRQEARLRLGLPQGRFMVGYVGRLHTLGQEKGVALLVEAISVLKQIDPSFGVALCCVGGPDEMAGQYRAFANQLGLASDDVVFVSQVPPTGIPLYLSAFDVCAMPFPWTQHYAYYMSPLKLFEYMAAERPILATDLPAVREVLQHKLNAYLVPPGDPQALAEGIRWLTANPDAARVLAQRAQVDVKQYTWSRRAGTILAFLNEHVQLRASRGAQ